MTTRNISWGVKAAGMWGWQPYHLLEPSGLVQTITFTFNTQETNAKMWRFYLNGLLLGAKLLNIAVSYVKMEITEKRVLEAVE
jgi:hypothetical protein